MRPEKEKTASHQWVIRHCIISISLMASLLAVMFVAIQVLAEPGRPPGFEWMDILGIAFGMMTLFLIGEGFFVFIPTLRLIQEAERTREESTRLKSQFLANMSHEIRTPMNAIFGMAELLMQSSLTPRQKGYVKALLHGADNLMSTLDDILDLSRIETGKLHLNPVVFDLREAAEDVMEMLSPVAHEKKIDLILEAPPAGTRVVADRNRLRQVLYHLMGNAVKFTENGHVLMRIKLMPVSDDKSSIEVTIEDTGIGIAGDRLSIIFEPFVQGDGTSTRTHGGAGLGLSLCQKLVALMNGRISIDSKPGSGTMVQFSVQCDMAPPASTATVRNLLRHKKILVVDDLAANRTMLAEHLKQAGMTCHLASSGTEALRLARQSVTQGKPYSLIITDYLMPEMDGETLTRAVRASADLAKIPVVVLTSAGEKGYTKLFADAGAAACLAKPVRSSELLETLHLVLEAKHREGILTSGAGNRIAAQELAQGSAPFHLIRILLVEDNRINREYATELMSSQGCIVTCAENGAMAMNILKEKSFDIIFMDCQMPVMDGFEATKAINSLISEKLMAPVPIIALTANAMQGDRERCLKAGMNDFMSKPLRKPNWEAIMIKWLKHKLKNETSPRPEQSLPKVSNENTSPAVNNSMLDTTILQDARQTMGSRFATVLRYYLEDTEIYLSQLEHAARNGDAKEVSAQAHSIKSSSRQFGVIQVSAVAEAIEHAAREGSSPTELTPKLAELRRAFNESRPHLQQIAEAA
ncbi:response regulator [bacterium]|nr:response regulator [bacterium]